MQYTFISRAFSLNCQEVAGEFLTYVQTCTRSATDISHGVIWGVFGASLHTTRTFGSDFTKAIIEAFGGVIILSSAAATTLLLLHEVFFDALLGFFSATTSPRRSLERHYIEYVHSAATLPGLLSMPWRGDRTFLQQQLPYHCSFLKTSQCSTRFLFYIDFTKPIIKIWEKSLHYVQHTYFLHQRLHHGYHRSLGSGHYRVLSSISHHRGCHVSQAFSSISARSSPRQWSKPWEV